MSATANRRDFVVRREGIDLAGTLWLPDSAPVASVLMYPGSGAADRHNGSYFATIRSHLLERRCAVCSFDKRGVGASYVPAVLEDEPAVDPHRFPRFTRRGRGQWKQPPQPWGDPEQRALDAETFDVLGVAIEQLPPDQREVLTMRDVLGWTASETCDALSITDANQRVLLHRARAKLRTALESHYDQGRHQGARLLTSAASSLRTSPRTSKVLSGATRSRRSNTPRRLPTLPRISQPTPADHRRHPRAQRTRHRHHARRDPRAPHASIPRTRRITATEPSKARIHRLSGPDLPVPNRVVLCA